MTFLRRLLSFFRRSFWDRLPYGKPATVDDELLNDELL
jgi:hypothetical protein